MELTVDVLGAQGDGIVRFEKGAGFVPFTLPGETVRVSGKWPKFQLEKILKASDQRVAAKCLHFQTCGGCSVQHLELGKYLNWKRQTLVDAFASEGLTPVVADCVPCPSSSPVVETCKRFLVQIIGRRIAGSIHWYHGRRVDWPVLLYKIGIGTLGGGNLADSKNCAFAAFRHLVRH